MRTRNQGYALAAFKKVTLFEDRTDKVKKKYGSMAHRLPVLVRSAGLAQALAYVSARGSEEHQVLLKHLAEVLGEQDVDSLLERSRRAELGDYMYLTYSVLTALSWFKRFAQSVLGVEPGDDSQGGDN